MTPGGAGLPPAGLTITIGLGSSLFDDRFGLAGSRPEALKELPLFAFDLLEPALSGGDLCIQACADDPQVAVHAIRNLSRIAFGTARIRWSQLGFGRTSSTTSAQATPRNLFGFKDGTANIKSEETADVDEFVWAGDDQGWMAGGSYLVTRKILMTIESWDRVQLQEQEADHRPRQGRRCTAVGRRRVHRARLREDAHGWRPGDPRGRARAAQPPLEAPGRGCCAAATTSWTAATTSGSSPPGLFFISFQRDPQQFVAVQSKLAKDPMNEYIRHVGSALFAVPPGAAPGRLGWRDPVRLG